MTYVNKELANKYLDPSQGQGSAASQDKGRLDEATIDGLSFETTGEQPHTVKSHNKRGKQGIGKKIALALAVIILIGALSPLSSKINLYMKESSASADIVEVANNSGFSTEGKLSFYETKPELVTPDQINTACPQLDQAVVEFGCYLPQQHKIYILRVNDPNYKEIEYTTAVHETLHAVWYKIDDQSRDDLAGQLHKFYETASNDATQSLHEALKSYSSDKNVVIGELHSFVGSETKPLYLPDRLNSHYQKYISNRMIPIDASVSFNSKIDSRVAQLNAENEVLSSTYDRIGKFKIEHLDNIRSAMRTNERYGDIYTYNKNVDAYNYNLEIYNQQVDAYNASRDAYNTEVDTFNQLLSSFSPTRQKVQENDATLTQ